MPERRIEPDPPRDLMPGVFWGLIFTAGLIGGCGTLYYLITSFSNVVNK